jgi:RNA polymerase sigma factor (TIGR02999 family)
MKTPSGDVTRLLLQWNRGDAAALERLIPLVAGELRRLAAHHLRRERAGHTLQPTALVNEAYLRLVDSRGMAWQDRAHFFGIASRLMRQILVEHARRRMSGKRGGGARQVTLEEWVAVEHPRAVDVLALEEALGRLAAIDARKAPVVELKFFGGLSVEETAEVPGVSAGTALRDWAMARAWLLRELGGGGDDA